jgi:hypothetical protein
VQRRRDAAAVQRSGESGEAAQHPAEEEEIQRAESGESAQHPAEEEEIQRAPRPGVVQRAKESKSKLRKRMQREYGAEFSRKLPKKMLKRIDEILEKLPRSHTHGNVQLLRFVAGGGIGGAKSAYDADDKQIEMVKPPLPGGFSMPWWMYLLLNKGNSLQRWLMDQGTGDVGKSGDAELGLTGSRKVFAGVSDVLSQERLVDWTIRHEMGHAVDQQVQAMSRRGKVPMFGGWLTHDAQKSEQLKEVAKAFLSIANFTDAEQTTKLQRSNNTLLDRATECITPAAIVSLGERYGDPIDRTFAGGRQRAADFDKHVRIANARPWTFADGGGANVTHGGRIFHIDYHGSWVSYLADARQNALSNYQFSSPGEWFAEAYAAFYDPKQDSPARKRLAPELQQWFTATLGPPSFSSAEATKSTGSATRKDGMMTTLEELDEDVDKALTEDPNKIVNVKKTDLPPDLQDLDDDS